MSQPPQAATAAPPSPAVPVGTATPGVATGTPRSAALARVDTTAGTGGTPSTTIDTPRQLRRLTTALILLGLLFGLAGALSFAGLAYALDRAEADTAQLIRVQKIQTNLLSADATATNAFLVGGLEPAQQRARYDAAISATGALVTEAANAQPADAAALSVLNRAVVDYAVAIEQARANNRQGFPVGAQYLRNASSDLRSNALPILDNLVSANAERAGNQMDSRVGLLFVIVGVLVLAGLVWVMLRVARRFKRTLNTGLVAATAVVLITLVAGVIALTQIGGSVNQIQSGSFSSVNAAAHARIQANNAKSNESLTLIARGSGAAFEKAWAASAADVKGTLTRLPRSDLATLWTAYEKTHTDIRALDDGGQWDQAVNRATGGGSPTAGSSNPSSSNTVFGKFDGAASSFLDSVSTEASKGLASPQALLVVLAILTFLAGVAAALLARWGLASRLQEYR